jgi:hypothetical protein
MSFFTINHSKKTLFSLYLIFVINYYLLIYFDVFFIKIKVRVKYLMINVYFNYGFQQFDLLKSTYVVL